jgi:CRISPR-associated protein Csm5
MKQQSLNIQLSALTPVCIGTGQILSPYSDFVIEDKKIYYVDQQLIKQRLAEKPHLIDEFVKGVANGFDNNRSTFDLNQFLYSKLGIDIRKEYRMKTSSHANESKQQLYTIIKNAGVQPYIPGSSLKGAIKTALLYDWLVNDAEGQKVIVRLLKNPKEEMVNKEIEQAFGRFNPGFSDSSLLDTDKMVCIDTKRLHIKKGNTAIPQTWESIATEAKATLSFSTKENANFRYVDWKELCRVGNQYAKAGIQCEWDILEEAAGEKMTDDVYNKLYDFYETMYNNIDEANENTAFLKLGSGKGYYFNSVGLALFEADKSEKKTAFLNFLKDSGFGKVYKKETGKMEDYDLDPHDFPITRVIDVNRVQPIGWVKLEIEK